ncbi:hypothetical protein GCM10027564_09960 [Luteimonas notoginsengisoli]
MGVPVGELEVEARGGCAEWIIGPGGRSEPDQSPQMQKGRRAPFFGNGTLYVETPEGGIKPASGLANRHHAPVIPWRLSPRAGVRPRRAPKVSGSSYPEPAAQRHGWSVDHRP